MNIDSGTATLVVWVMTVTFAAGGAFVGVKIAINGIQKNADQIIMQNEKAEQSRKIIHQKIEDHEIRIAKIEEHNAQEFRK